MGIGPAQWLGQAVVYHSHDLRGLAAAPAVAALVALVGAWLGRRQLALLEPVWVRPIALAAVVVGAIGFVINVAAFVGLVTASQGGFVSG